MTDNIKVLNTPLLELIRIKPEMYWGKKQPNSRDVVLAMVNQLLIQNCENINIHKIDDWYFIGSEMNWVSPGLDSGITIQELFTKGCGFPEEKVAGSLRSEVFIYDFATDVVLWFQNELQIIKGNLKNQENLIDPCINWYKSGVAVGFKGNK